MGRVPVVSEATPVSVSDKKSNLGLLWCLGVRGCWTVTDCVLMVLCIYCDPFTYLITVIIQGYH